MSRCACLRTAAMAALAFLPVFALSLEPRFDHRETQGLVVEPFAAFDVVTINGHGTHSFWRPGLRIAYGWDVLGEGNELFLGAQTAFTWHDPDRERIRLALDARYRNYFGTEHWKTFFEVGIWAPLSSRLGIGPLVTLGTAYDFSRWTGVYADVGFAPALGAARVASFNASAGAHFRF